MNTRFEIDSQKNQILQEQMTSRDYQLRKCGDFLSRIIQGMLLNINKIINEPLGGAPSEIMSLKNARLPIQDLLQASANRVPTTATVYHINAIQLVDEVDLGKLFKYAMIRNL